MKIEEMAWVISHEGNNPIRVEIDDSCVLSMTVDDQTISVDSNAELQALITVLQKALKIFKNWD